MTFMSIAKKYMPGVAGLVTFLFAPPAPGWGSVAEKLEMKNGKEALQSSIASISGVKLGGIGGQVETNIDIFSTLNPLDFSNAPTTKAVLWTSTSLEAIDAIGKMIKSVIKDVK